MKTEKERNVNLNSVVGSRIKELRDHRGITQSEMGRMLGHTDVYISQIETGKRRIGLDLLEKIAQSLDVSPLIFFNDPLRGEELNSQVSALTRRVEMLNAMTQDLLQTVKDLSEQRQPNVESDPATSEITAAALALDPISRELLLKIANAIRANPTAAPPLAFSSAEDGLSK
jgi:transcriptional regulator with XRE-family HTH domain